MPRSNSMLGRVLCVAVVCVLGILGRAQAGLIEVDQGEPDRTFLIPMTEPGTGQSFTAEDAQIASIGLGIEDFNPVFSLVPVHASLYEGSGGGGTLLGTVDVIPPAGVSFETDMVSFDFSFVTLTVGQVYTVLATTDNMRWGIDSYQNQGGPDLYTGGEYLEFGSPLTGGGALWDARFRVVPIPVPGAMSLLAIGIGSVALIRRRLTA